MKNTKYPVNAYYRRHSKIVECQIHGYVRIKEGDKVVVTVDGCVKLLNKSSVFFEEEITVTINGVKKIKGQITREDIIRIVSKHTGVKITDIKSTCRNRPLVYARFMYISLCYTFRIDTMKEIASSLKITNHSSIFHGKKMHVELMKQDDDYAEMFNKCEAEIKAII